MMVKNELITFRSLVRIRKTERQEGTNTINFKAPNKNKTVGIIPRFYFVKPYKLGIPGLPFFTRKIDFFG
jgi:hypothetical protein